MTFLLFLKKLFQCCFLPYSGQKPSKIRISSCCGMNETLPSPPTTKSLVESFLSKGFFSPLFSPDILSVDPGGFPPPSQLRLNQLFEVWQSKRKDAAFCGEAKMRRHALAFAQNFGAEFAVLFENTWVDISSPEKNGEFHGPTVHLKSREKTLLFALAFPFSGERSFSSDYWTRSQIGHPWKILPAPQRHTCVMCEERRESYSSFELYLNGRRGFQHFCPVKPLDRAGKMANFVVGYFAVRVWWMSFGLAFSWPDLSSPLFQRRRLINGSRQLRRHFAACIRSLQWNKFSHTHLLHMYHQKLI